MMKKILYIYSIIYINIYIGTDRILLYFYLSSFVERYFYLSSFFPGVLLLLLK